MEELFRLASLIGCEPEDEERHRKDLLEYILGIIPPKKDIQIDIPATLHRNVGYNQAIDDMRAKLTSGEVEG